VRFGVDKEDAVTKIGKLKERLDALEKVSGRHFRTVLAGVSSTTEQQPSDQRQAYTTTLHAGGNSPLLLCASYAQAMLKEREVFSKRVPRKVPVTWVGSANEVRDVSTGTDVSGGLQPQCFNHLHNHLHMVYTTACCCFGGGLQVKLVGDFDNWTRGVDLGIPDMETDGGSSAGAVSMLWLIDFTCPYA
jgi:hypothetical protein